MASPQTPEPGSIDIRPDLPAAVQGWDLEQFQEAWRTLGHRLGVFQLLVQSRGLEDELSQQAWRRLAELSLGNLG